MQFTIFMTENFAQSHQSTLGAMFSTLCLKDIPADQYRKDAGDEAYNLSKKTRTSDH